jgi:CheY-like chemotaxis protein
MSYRATKAPRASTGGEVATDAPSGMESALPTTAEIANVVEAATKRLALVAEDDEELRVLAHMAVQRASDGAEVSSHPDGGSAIARVDQLAAGVHEDLHFVFTDFYMPEANGLDLYHHVRLTHGRHVPFLLASDGGGMEDVHRETVARLKETDLLFDFLNKPYSRADVVTAAHQLFATRERLKAVKPVAEER